MKAIGFLVYTGILGVVGYGLYVNMIIFIK